MLKNIELFYILFWENFTEGVYDNILPYCFYLEVELYYYSYK